MQTAPMDAIRQPDNAKAVQAVEGALQNVLMETINVKVLLPINAQQTVLGNGIKTVPTAVTCQKANVKSALLVIINAVALIHIIVPMDIGNQMSTVPMDAMSRQEHVRNVRQEKNAKILIRTLVRMVFGQRMNIVPTAVIRQLANAIVAPAEVRLQGINRALVILMELIAVPTAHI